MRSIVFHQRELFLCLTPSNLYRRLLRCVSSRSIDQESADELQRRQKLRSLAIEGTVNLYERHVFIIDNNFSPENWPKQLEQSDHLVAQYTKEFDDVRANNSKQIIDLKITAANAIGENIQSTHDDSHDILVFPENVRLHGITKHKLRSLVELLAQKAPITRSKYEYSHLEGHQAFVCVHSNRDFRCACAGPKLISWLQTNALKQNVSLSVWASSHYGGHRFAGNCIIYPEGDWYGMVNSEDDANRILDIVKGTTTSPINELWRGRMGMTKEEQKEYFRLKAS